MPQDPTDDSVTRIFESLKPVDLPNPPKPGGWDKLPAIRVDDPLVLKDTFTIPDAGTGAPCLLCAKEFETRPSLGEADQVCEECYKTYNECAVVVCEKCRRVHARLKPGPQSDGYVVNKRQILHLVDCPACCRGKAVLSPEGHEVHTIREIDEWHRHARDKRIILTPAGSPAALLRAKPPERTP